MCAERSSAAEPTAGLPGVLCLGAAHWDVIGLAPEPLTQGADVAGRVRRRPGGVALNIAAALARLGLSPALIATIGTDAAGADLAAAAGAMGIDCRYFHRDPDRPTGTYIAIEDPSGLVAAIADAAALEAAGPALLAPLTDGSLGSAARPWTGALAIDGNLTGPLLAEIATHPAFAAADLRLIPASPFKAARLAPFLGHPRARFYLNLAEAGALAGQDFADTAKAALSLIYLGAARVLVTDGPRPASLAGPEGCISETPRTVAALGVTGAGDALVAGHIAAELAGAEGRQALQAALAAAASHLTTGA